ncbi:MAG: hypothetical protein R3Y61_07480 [Rikenellaceae bacterium]
MKKIIILTALAILSLVEASAQPNRYNNYGRRDWYLVPSATYMAGDYNDGWASGITVGRYLDERSNFSMEGYIGYYFSSYENDYQTISFSLAYENHMFRSRIFYGSAAAGIGIMTNGLTMRSGHNSHHSFTDAILPLKLGCGLILTPNLSIGVNFGYTLDLSYAEYSLFTFGPNINVRF